MMYRFVFLLCFFSRTILCTPNMEILPNSKSSEVCEDFIILGGNFESVTFKVTGNDSTFLINRFYGPELYFAPDYHRACPLISVDHDCRSIVWDQYTCTCEQKGPEEFHLTFNNTPNATREPFTLYMKWDDLNGVTKLSNNFTLKGVKGRRDCWTPTMTILNTKTSSYCSNDNLGMNIDYQLIKFNISWSNSEYVLDRTGTPTVVNSSTEEDLCPLIDQNNDCSFRMFGGYSCLCNKITPDEYHLTFKYTPTQANRSLTLYMKWVGKNGASVIKSDKYTFKEATDKCEPEELWAAILTGAGIAFGILTISAISGFMWYKFGSILKTAPTVEGEDIDEHQAPEPKADPEDELPQREENILRTSSSVVDP